MAEGNLELRMLDVLRMLHVQFNQDVNFNQLLTMLESLQQGQSEGSPVEIEPDLLGLTLDAVRPVSRFSDGIGAAAKIIGDLPVLTSLSVDEFLSTLKETWLGKWESDAEKRWHDFHVTVEPSVKDYSGKFLHADFTTLFKALNEMVVNAFKHSREHSEVLLVVDTDGTNLSLVITNRPSTTPTSVAGKQIYGVPEDVEQQAYRLFYTFSKRAQLTIYEEDWPMGLGLPLVRAVFQGADGSFTLKNEKAEGENEGEGAVLVTARASLPLRDEAISSDAEDGGIDLF